MKSMENLGRENKALKKTKINGLHCNQYYSPYS